jgi:hypothetical protein
MSGLLVNLKSTYAQNATVHTGIGTKKIPLTQNQFAIVDDDDYERISQHKWCVSRSKTCLYARRSGKYNGRKITIQMHRAVLGLEYADNRVIDHINRNGLDNRKSNLRIVNQKINSYNCKMQRHNTSGYRGVAFYEQTNKYAAYIKIDGVQKHLGFYKTPIEAALAHDVASLLVYKENAIINFRLGVENE